MKNEIILDPVIGRFDYEKPYSEKKDYYMKTLDGIPIQFLNGIDRNEAIELVDIFGAEVIPDSIRPASVDPAGD